MIDGTEEDENVTIMKLVCKPLQLLQEKEAFEHHPKSKARLQLKRTKKQYEKQSKT